ncbi:hypothetical protein F5146DRAFT_1130820 [Armillaria mellea]|nr:hypothetical protein F5146DRAFT_1130820 [Armillaria mellea]
MKKLHFGDAPIHSLDALACVVYKNNKIILFLAGKAQVDMYYEVAASLNRLLFKSLKANDALLFMTISSTPLHELKCRGYNVDHILRQQQMERQATQEATKARIENIALMLKQALMPDPLHRIGSTVTDELLPQQPASDDNSLIHTATGIWNMFQNWRWKIGLKSNITTPYPPIMEELKLTGNHITDTGPPPIPAKTCPIIHLQVKQVLTTLRYKHQILIWPSMHADQRRITCFTIRNKCGSSCKNPNLQQRRMCGKMQEDELNDAEIWPAHRLFFNIGFISPEDEYGTTSKCLLAASMPTLSTVKMPWNKKLKMKFRRLKAKVRAYLEWPGLVCWAEMHEWPSCLASRSCLCWVIVSPPKSFLVPMPMHSTENVDMVIIDTGSYDLD